jgi:hypothetical protein
MMILLAFMVIAAFLMITKSVGSRNGKTENGSTSSQDFISTALKVGTAYLGIALAIRVGGFLLGLGLIYLLIGRWIMAHDAGPVDPSSSSGLFEFLRVVVVGFIVWLVKWLKGRRRSKTDLCSSVSIHATVVPPQTEAPHDSRTWPQAPEARNFCTSCGSRFEGVTRYCATCGSTR